MIRLFVLMILALLLAGCDGRTGATQTVPGQVRVVTVRLGSAPFKLEVADTWPAKHRGLMYRKSMPQDEGMIFTFGRPEVLSFYMKNTYIPLDIVYLDGAGKVVSIRQMQPLDETSVSSGAAAQYAIEINQGMAQKAGVREGDLIALPQSIVAK